MSYTTRQVTVGSVSTLAGYIPGGVATTTLTNGSTVAMYYATGGTAVSVAPGTAPSVSAGAPLPAGASVTLPGWAGSAGAPVYVIAASGSASALGFVVSTGA